MINGQRTPADFVLICERFAGCDKLLLHALAVRFSCPILWLLKDFRFLTSAILSRKVRFSMVSDVTTERSNRTVRVDQDQLEMNARAAAFMIVNSLVIQLRTLELGLGISSKTLTVYLTIALATVQKLARQYPIPVSLRSPDPVPPQLSGAISRRAIAATSGLPRETVRRIVDELIADGRIMRVGRSAVASVPGTLRRDGYLLGRVAAEVARNATLLLHLGVLTLNGPGHFKGEHDRSSIDPNSVADAAEFETIF